MNDMHGTKYLRVTVYDNNYTHTLEKACELLYKMFSDSRFPTEKHIYSSDFDQCFRHFWAGVHFIDGMLWSENKLVEPICFIENRLPYFEFINIVDIPDDDNNESVYIPMFSDGEILVR